MGDETAYDMAMIFTVRVMRVGVW